MYKNSDQTNGNIFYINNQQGKAYQISFNPSKIAKLKKERQNKQTRADEDVEKSELLYIASKTVCEAATLGLFLKMLDIDLPYDPTFPLLGTQQKEMKIYGHAKICA